MKNMTLKSAILIFALLSLCACGATEKKQADTAPRVSDYNVPAENFSQEIDNLDVQMINAKPFKEGLAWVEFTIDGEEERWGVINKEGKMIFMLPKKDIENLRQYVEGTFEFGNGYTYVSYHGKLDVYRKDGTLVQSYPDSVLDDVEKKVLAYGDGYVYTREDVRGFDSSDYKYTIYGPEGEELNTFMAPEKEEVVYLGKGVFQTSGGMYFAQTNQWLFDLPPVEWHCVSEFGDNVVAIDIKSTYVDGFDENTVYKYTLYLLYGDGSIVQKEMQNFPGGQVTQFEKIRDGVGLYSQKAMTYNFETDTVMQTSEEYAARWETMKSRDLMGNSCVMLDNQNLVAVLPGDDDCYYTVLFDKNWNRIAEPIKGSMSGYGENIFVVQMENGEHIVYNEDGKRIYSVEAKGYHPHYYTAYPGNNGEFNISEGIMLVRNTPGDGPCTLVDEKGDPIFKEIDISNALYK